MYQHAKNQLISSVRSRNTADIRVSRPKRPRPFLTITTQKLLKELLAFLNFYQHTKYQFISIHSFLRYSQRVLRPEWPHPFLTMPTTIFFNKFLISMNLYQHAKNQVFSSCSRDTVDLKIQQCDWPRAFWPTSDFGQTFLKYGICPRTQQLI